MEYTDNVVTVPDTFNAQLLSCVHCLSVWIALLLRASPKPAVQTLAIAAVASLLERFTDG